MAEPAEETSSSGREKSPWVVISALFPHFDPPTVEHIASTLLQGGLPTLGEASSSIPPSSDVDPQGVLPAPGEASSSILPPGDADPPIALPVWCWITALSPPPNALRPSRDNVALGAKKSAAGKGPSDSSGPTVPTVVPLEIPSRSATAFDLHVTHRQGRWGKEKTTESEVEELSHTMTDLYCRAKALDNIREKEVEPLKKLVTASGLRIKELEQELTAAEKEAATAKRAAEEATNRMKDFDSLARFLC
nr:hypothetical protein Iba_chr07dCG5590 [Ipomoea batatas]